MGNLGDIHWAKNRIAQLFSRNSVYVGSIFFGAFAFGLTYDMATSKFWDSHNKGKQWKDIRDKVRVYCSRDCAPIALKRGLRRVQYAPAA